MKKFLLNITSEKIGTIMTIGAIAMATQNVIMETVLIKHVVDLGAFILVQFTEFVTIIINVVVIVTIGGDWEIFFFGLRKNFNCNNFKFISFH